MRKCLLSVVTAALVFSFVGCGGDDGPPPRSPDGSPTPEAQKEIDDMKARMTGTKKKATVTPREKELEKIKAGMLRK